MVSLRRLLADLPEAKAFGDADVDIAGIRHDSRQTGPGDLFVAVPGFKADGHDFLADAVARGAAALVVQADRRDKWEPVVSGSATAVVVLPDSRTALAGLAAAFYEYPARKLRVIGVTGTDGKTSLVHLIAHLLETAGEKAGLISTIQCEVNGEPLPEEYRHTTPEAPEVQRMLAQMVEAGCRYAVIESTSHGLALHRLDGCEYDIAVVTDVGADHLDFHGSQEAYLEAKGRLFAMLDGSADKGLAKAAVLNADDPSCDYLRRKTGARVLTYGIEEAADVTASGVEEAGWGSRFRLVTPARSIEVRIASPGVFNVYNGIAAAAVGLAAGVGLPVITRALSTWTGAPGRMERVEEGQPFDVVVDFAHAPDALRRVLQFLRSHSRGRIIAVFGCIGERDKQRRFPMGQIAGESADYAVITDDNPYTEDRDAIIGEIAAGLLASGRLEGHHFVRISNRRQAIAHALSMAVDEDVVLLAGKGHERTITVGDTVYECDDREVARRVLREMFPKAVTTT